jgi:hypothetical protein
MPKKSNKKTFSSEEKKNKSDNRKSKNLPEEESEDYEDNDLEDEENEEEEEDEENDDFIASEGEDESYGVHNRNIYRDESIFNKADERTKNDKN